MNMAPLTNSVLEAAGRVQAHYHQVMLDTGHASEHEATPDAVEAAPLAARKPTALAFAEFEADLHDFGLRESLARLLKVTDYRFIGIFRFEGGQANAALHYDRENPGQLSTQEVPETATYCCHVRNLRGAFATADAMRDERLAAHPARHVVAAYCGVPVMDADGLLLGTLCHYDFVPRDPEQVDLELMVQVASALAYRRLVPPYPQL